MLNPSMIAMAAAIIYNKMRSWFVVKQAHRHKFKFFRFFISIFLFISLASLKNALQANVTKRPSSCDSKENIFDFKMNTFKSFSPPTRYSLCKKLAEGWWRYF
jgi:hypothetical protein